MTHFSFVPSSNSIVSISDPWRAIWADMAPFKGPWLAFCVASRTTEIQWHYQVCRSRHGGPRTLSRSADANLALIVRFLKLHFLTPNSLIVKSQQNIIELMAKPAALGAWWWRRASGQVWCRLCRWQWSRRKRNWNTSNERLWSICLTHLMVYWLIGP